MGISFTFADVLSAYAAEYADGATHDDLTSAFGALLHDGAIIRVGDSPGRTRRATRYAFRGGRKTANPVDDLDAAVVAIVEAHYNAMLAPIATGVVREALRAQGLWTDRFSRLHRILSELAADGAGTRYRPRAPRQAPHQLGGPLRRASGFATSGAAAGFWLPRWAPDQCAIAPSSATDALRRAIMAACSALARPVSKREIIAWLEAQPTKSPIRSAVTPGQVSSLLRNLKFRDAREFHRGRLHPVTGPLTCYGGCPERYACEVASNEAIALCRLLDAMYAVRPSRELADLARLRRARVDPVTATALVGLRTLALARALARYVGDLDVDTLAAIVSRGLRGAEELQHWIARSQRSSVARHRRWLEVSRLAADLDATLTTWRQVGRDEWMRSPLMVVGKGTTEDIARLHELAARELARGVVVAPRVHFAYRNARRFPSAGSTNRMAADERARVDRADALAELYGRAVDPGLRSAVRAGHMLLGHVLRDTAALARLQAQAADDNTRKALCAAQFLVTADAAESELFSAFASATLR